MYVVGLTGGIGSGKSTVAKLFTALGIDVIDADQLSRDVVNPGSEALLKISQHFGSEILTEDGLLNRKALREIVFAKESERLWLEALLHPLIAEQIRIGILDAGSSYCILESPLLLETTQQELVNRILVVDVSESTQLERSLSRDGSSEETIRAIIESQMPRKYRLKYADDVLANEDSAESLQTQVELLHHKYLQLAHSNE